MPSDLYERIYTTVRTIPYGQVATYGQIAEMTGMPSGARVVGWALRALVEGSDVPWQRIIAKGGEISIVNPLHPPVEQIKLLESEGLRFSFETAKFRIIDPVWFRS